MDFNFSRLYADQREAIHKLIKEINEKRTAMQLKRVDALLEMRAVLTPEQQKKFKEMARPRGHREKKQ